MRHLTSSSVLRYALLLFIFAGILSCSKDSDDPTPETPSDVVGSWKIAAMTVSPAYEGVSDMLPILNAVLGNDCLSQIKMDFKGDGSISGSAPAACTTVVTDNDIVEDKSTWKVVGTKIQIKEGSDIAEYDLEVNKTQMKWSYDETEDGVKYKYTIVFNKA
ncbi:lipocalin family protein [Dyadobacter sp. CY312]|uniref:lipocalin family protein n=1 Tax=Dyadobacter sp. CY312 TaxID=2907303 RepID=UPI001F424B2E|nr:lipocalin family protein [Dyadobacter sp. CY312]MCE7043851.1 hypothetical protein [Dyadobacter sp. CY312]